MLLIMLDLFTLSKSLMSSFISSEVDLLKNSAVAGSMHSHRKTRCSIFYCIHLDWLYQKGGCHLQKKCVNFGPLLHKRNP